MLHQIRPVAVKSALHNQFLSWSTLLPELEIVCSTAQAFKV